MKFAKSEKSEKEHLKKTASICFTSKCYGVAEFGLDKTSTDSILFNQIKMQPYDLYVS